MLVCVWGGELPTMIQMPAFRQKTGRFVVVTRLCRGARSVVRPCSPTTGSQRGAAARYDMCVSICTQERPGQGRGVRAFGRCTVCGARAARVAHDTRAHACVIGLGRPHTCVAAAPGIRRGRGSERLWVGVVDVHKARRSPGRLLRGCAMPAKAAGNQACGGGHGRGCNATRSRDRRAAAAAAPPP